MFLSSMSHRLLSVAAGSAGLVLYAASALATSGHVALNDFWGNLFIATHLELSVPQSLYSGFYPIGYPLLLRAGGDHAVMVATIASVISGAVAAGAVALLAARLGGVLEGAA